jgi:multidrug resistance efflux pump
MADESETKKLFDRLKEATANVTQMTREGVETLQTKRELSQAYGDLGRTTADLVQSGAVSHADLTPLVDRIAELKAQLEAEEADEAASEAPPDTDER